MKISDRLVHMTPSATRAVAEIAKDMRAKGIPVISFSTGEPDFKSPAGACRYAKKAIQDGKTHYTPTAGTNTLREEVANYYKTRFDLNYQKEQIMIASGAKPLLFEALGALVNPGDEVILPAPSWVSYYEQIRFFDGTPVIVDSKPKTLELDIDAVCDAVTDRTVAIMVNSPHNPTGNIYNEKTMIELCHLAVEKQIIIINDEIYERLTFDGFDYKNPLCNVPEAQDYVININGVSKSYAMTGWRIGYALGPEKLIKKMSALQGHLTSGPSSISQWAAVGALREDQVAVNEMVAEYQQRKEIVVEMLDQMPHISYHKPKGTFYAFVDIRKTFDLHYMEQSIVDDVDFCQKLLQNHHVAVIPGTAFLLNGYIRISFATSETNIRTGLTRIHEFLEKLE